MRLWAVYLGGHLAADRIGEDHELVFVVADEVEAAKKAAKKKWRGVGRAHVDAIRSVDEVDGYVVSVSQRS